MRTFLFQYSVAAFFKIAVHSNFTSQACQQEIINIHDYLIINKQRDYIFIRHISKKTLSGNISISTAVKDKKHITD